MRLNALIQVERRLAPFWRGLNDFSDSWTEHQLMAAARGMPIPPPDQIPPELEYTIPPRSADGGYETSDKTGQLLTVPISSRSPSMHSDASHNPQTLTPAQSLPSPSSPIASGTSSSPLFRGRAKTLAALASSNKNSPTADMTPKEVMLKLDPFVNGQPIEAYLYKDASECPICFLYYPPYLNRTRCCDQPICSECFVQIKRPDPHPPEHGEPDQAANTENSPEGERQQREPNEGDSQLVSEPSACPFCVQPEFGVTYAQPPFRRGLAYATPNGLRPGMAASPVSSTSSLGSANAGVTGTLSPPVAGRRRATSLSASDPGVITTDRIRPDWAQKLANARAHAARRSAAATALHTAAYLMSSPGGDSRTFGGRRGVLRRTGGGNSGTQSPVHRPTGGSPALQALAFLSERRNTGDQPANEEGNVAPPRGSSRRSRIDDLEEMMMLEAIRMSLASEEERQKKEEKEIRKEAKRREKEAKKAEKQMRKNGIYNHSQSNSALFSSGTVSRVESSSSLILGEEPSAAAKGKAVDRVSPAAAETGPSETHLAPGNGTSPSTTIQTQLPSRLEAEPFPAVVQPSPTEPSRPSHLRHMSSASSTSSSFIESGAGDQIGSGTPSNGTNPALEPMFNFRSLAAVIGDEEKAGAAEHVEDTVQPPAGTSAAPAVETKPSTSEGPVPVESQPPQEHRPEFIPKELGAHSVEVVRETTT
jgi:hypothetical protein